MGKSAVFPVFSSANTKGHKGIGRRISEDRGSPISKPGATVTQINNHKN